MATTNNGKDGGLLKGKPHYDKSGKSLGGIKAIVTDTKQMVELEGGEVIINKEASKKHWKELSRINQSAGNGVPILPPDKAMADTEEYKQGGRTIEFNPNHIPQKWIYNYAKKIKDKHPKVWALGGNEFGNTAFENLERALKRGYWTENEEWMYVKWQSFNARHKGDFRIAGVIANLKWLNKVDKGWDFMKNLIETEIKKRENKLETGGELAKGIKSEQEHIETATKLYNRQITPKQAPESIAKEHLAEDSQYYTKLEEFESKFDTGGTVVEKGIVIINPDREYGTFDLMLNGDRVSEFGESKKLLPIEKIEWGLWRRNLIQDRIDSEKGVKTDNLGVKWANKNAQSLKSKALKDLMIQRDALDKFIISQLPTSYDLKLGGFYKYTETEINKLFKNNTLPKYAIEKLLPETVVNEPEEQTLTFFKTLIGKKIKRGTGEYATIGKIIDVESLNGDKISNSGIFIYFLEDGENVADKIKVNEYEIDKYKNSIIDEKITENKEPEEQKPTHKEFLVKYYINTGKKHNVKTWICAQNRNEAIDIAKKDDDRYTELISCKPTGNTSWSSSCNKEDAEFDENDEGADEEKHFDSNYKPIFWHLTQSEFCEYAENYEVDTRLDGTKARLECKDFYKYVVVLPLLDDSAERNVFLLAVETGLLPYEKVKEIIESVGAWKESNRFVKQLLQYDKVKNYSSNIWLIPKDLYLSSEYYKNNYTRKEVDKMYSEKIYKNGILDNEELRSYLSRGIVKLKDVEARLKEANISSDKFVDKLKDSAKTFSSKNKLKGLKLLLEDDLPEKKEVEVSKPITKDIKNSLFPENEQKFVDKLIRDNYADVKYNKIKLENLAKEFGIKEQNLAKELAELSISFVARVYAHDTELTPKERYEKIVKLYETQVNLSHRTSESIMLQQYSTPAPIGYLAGLFCGFDKEGGNYFEPSAGNGLLTIAGNTEDFTVNEIDTVRNRNLSVLGFKKVLKQDASEPFKEFEHKFDAVITNPPFGKTEVVTYGKSDIKSLEQVMSLRALDTMKDNGRCAIIIGGHTEYDKEGRIQSGKNRTYFVYLYKHYNVMDVINISGRHLYSRQGTAFNTRLILIDGRKETPSGFPPLIENPIPMNEINSPTPVNSFDVLWERINKSI